MSPGEASRFGEDLRVALRQMFIYIDWLSPRTLCIPEGLPGGKYTIPSLFVGESHDQGATLVVIVTWNSVCKGDV